MGGPALAANNISKAYRPARGGPPFAALSDVSFEIGETEFLCVVGPTGCGKSTLLKILAGLLPASSGSVATGGGPADERPANAMVFQEHGLFPWMTVVENVAFGLEGRPGSRADKRQRALRFVESVGLGTFAALYPHELSVGMRQKAAIARAFLRDPRVLLMDEPLASLDFQSRLLMREELLKIWSGSRRAVVFVTHDIEEAILLGDRLLVMTGRPGRIREEIAIPLPRPRRLEDAAGAAATEIKWRVWRSLEDEARRSMAFPT